MTTREWYRPLPPYREVDWSMRNNTNYEETGVLTALQLTSAFPEIILENFYKKSRNSIESGKNDAPLRLRDSGRPAGYDARRVHRQHSTTARHRDRAARPRK